VTASAIAALTQRVTELPRLPQAVTEVMLLLRHEQLSVQRCIALIERDQALAARTLRLANSAFYGVPGRVGSIGDAVRLLGLRTISGVLTAAALHHAIAVDACPEFDFERYWRHAIGVALATRALATIAGGDADEAFLAGLMHDIGQLVLAAYLPEQAGRALAMARACDLPAEQAETAVLGIAHARIGALVAAHWRLPSTITEAIASHHAPGRLAESQVPCLAGLIQVADAIVHALDIQGDDAEAVPTIEPTVWQRLKLSHCAALGIFSEVDRGLHGLSDILQAA